MTEQMSIGLRWPPGAHDAPWLVLGHSLGTSCDIWRDASVLLGQHFRVITWELPGHGAATAAAGPFTIGDLADTLVSRLAERGVSHFHYVGVSIGGTVGLDLVLRHASSVDALVAISTGANVDARADWAARADSVRAEGTGSLVAGSRQRWFASMTREQYPARVEATLEALSRTDDRSYAWACEALAAFDATADLAEVDRPVLALWGEHDVLVPERKSSQLAAAVPRGEVRCVRGAAHAAPLEQPAAVAEQLIAFLKRS